MGLHAQIHLFEDTPKLRIALKTFDMEPSCSMPFIVCRHRNQDGIPVVTDSFTLVRDTKQCPNKAAPSKRGPSHNKEVTLLCSKLYKKMLHMIDKRTAWQPEPPSVGLGGLRRCSAHGFVALQHGHDNDNHGHDDDNHGHSKDGHDSDGKKTNRKIGHH